jgi:hypothetical protein
VSEEGVRTEESAPSAEDAQSAQAAKNRRKKRRRASQAMALLAAVLLPLGTLTVWARNQVLNTDRYVRTVTPLASDPAVQNAIVNRVTTVVDDNVDFKEVAQELLPAQAKPLAGVLATSAQTLTRQVVEQIVHSPQFEKFWVAANRAAHTALVHLVTGKGSKVTTNENGQIAVQLGPLVQQVLDRIDQRFGIDLASRVPTDKIKTEFVIFDSPDLAKVQRELRWFNALSYLTAFLAIVALIGAVLVAERRRSGLRRAGISVAASMAIMLVAYAIGRQIYLNNLPSGVNSAAAESGFNIITRYLHQAFQLLFVLGLIVLVVAWWLGKSRSSRRAHHYWAMVVGKASGGHAGTVPTWVGEHLRALRIAIAVAGAAVIALWNLPTPKVVIVTAIVVVILLAVVQLIAAPARVAAAGPAEVSPPPP